MESLYRNTLNPTSDKWTLGLRRPEDAGEMVKLIYETNPERLAYLTFPVREALLPVTVEWGEPYRWSERPFEKADSGAARAPQQEKGLNSGAIGLVSQYLLNRVEHLSRHSTVPIINIGSDSYFRSSILERFLGNTNCATR